MGTLCAQLLSQFYTDSFETLQMILSSSENVHVVFLCDPQIIFCRFPGHFLAFNAINVHIGGTLCVQPLLQFYSVLIEILNVLIVLKLWPGFMIAHIY